MDDGPQEIELKFVLPRGRAPVLPAELDALLAAPATALLATYYDTPRRALRAAGLSLRIRGEDGKLVQTVKRGGAGLGRGEWDAQVKARTPDLAALRRTPAGKLIDDVGRLKPLFTLEVQRRKLVVVEGLARVEISLDQGTVRAGKRARSFVELELELEDGPVWDLMILARTPLAVLRTRNAV